MKLTRVAVLILGLTMGGEAALAQTTDDVKWINQCVRDNKGGASDAVILKYCTCMNNKMSDNETRSISEWEKSNPRARAACDKESGWK